MVAGEQSLLTFAELAPVSAGASAILFDIPWLVWLRAEEVVNFLASAGEISQ
jgi:hypothetical protein